MVAGPRIAALLTASEPDEVPPWFATEYVQGLTLAEYVTDPGEQVGEEVIDRVRRVDRLIHGLPGEQVLDQAVLFLAGR